MSAEDALGVFKSLEHVFSGVGFKSLISIKGIFPLKIKKSSYNLILTQRRNSLVNVMKLYDMLLYGMTAGALDKTAITF